MRTDFPFALFAALVLSAMVGNPVGAQEPPLPPSNRTPVLILDHAGPSAPVTAVAFSPDAGTLYVAGLDKLIRRYALRNGKYVPLEPLRVPIGPGNAGAVNALAVSPDGKWLAAAGRAPLRGEVWSASADGVVTSSRFLPPILKRDAGVVYLFDTANPEGGRVLRGQQSEVRALAFASPAPTTGPVLVTAGIEWTADGTARTGVVRVFDVGTGKEIDARSDLPASVVPPGLAAWGTGGKGLRVAVAWVNEEPKERLLVWDAPGGKMQSVPDVGYSFPMAVRVRKGAATQIITGGFKNGGLLSFRSPDQLGNAPAVVKLAAPEGRSAQLLAIAPVNLGTVGDATTVLVEIAPRPPGTIGRAAELRLLGPDNGTLARVPVSGLSTDIDPVFVASPDGRYLAVAGFSDHRVEVFPTAPLAAGKPVLETVPGAGAGFSRVAFAAGNKLWLGGPNDEPAKGGVILDPGTRTAVPNDGRTVVDSPPDGPKAVIEKPDPARPPRRVGYSLDGVRRELELGAGEEATVAILHPGKPAWEPGLGPIVAVAHTDARNALTLITLFDAASGKKLLQLGGPALPVRSLAFSGSRPLLAAAGDDGTVFVWALRDLRRALPVIDGVIVTTTDKGLMVTSVDPNSVAGKGLVVGDVIEAIGGTKGELKPVATALEFVLAVRTFSVGDNARLRVKGKAAVVVVPIAAGVGNRRPLVSFWVDPRVRNGRHDWIGWTGAGPYDANAPEAEGRIGWVTATGAPARPVAFADVGQYRKEFYKNDFLRFVLDEADFDAALKGYNRVYPPPVPKLGVNLTAPVDALADGRRVIRQKAEGLEVLLGDPAGLIPLDRAVLRWRANDGPWREVRFTAGQAVLDLKGYEWRRGDHRFQVRVYRTPDEPPALELTAVFTYVPPAPALAVTIDKKAVRAGDALTSKNEAVEVSVEVEAGAGGTAEVVVRTNGPDGDKGIKIPVDPKGGFAPVKVKLNPPPANTAIEAIATGVGDGADPALESTAVEVTVRGLPADPTPPPRVTLSLTTPHDPPLAPTGPRVVHGERATFTAAVAPAPENPVEAFEWDLGGGKWERGALDQKGTQTREVVLPAGVPRTIRVRAKSKNSPFAEDAVLVVFAGLGDAALTPVAGTATRSALELTGTLKLPAGAPPGAFETCSVRVRVCSVREGRSRESVGTVDPKTGTWRAGVALFPGENELELIVGNEWATARKKVARVSYLRPPGLVGVLPMEIGTGSVGRFTAVVVTWPELGPTELLVKAGGAAAAGRVPFRRAGPPVRLFGLDWLVLTAEGVSVTVGEARARALEVMVRNAEGESAAATVPVPVPAAVEVPVRPPTILLSHESSPIAHKQQFVTDQPQFELAVRLTSETPIVRAEVWYGGETDAGLERAEGVDPKGAGPGGLELAARTTFPLRRGLNRVRVVTANAGRAAEVECLVSYTPPPLRIVLDSIAEVEAGGKTVPVRTAPGDGPLTVGEPILEIRGRAIWEAEDDPALRDPSLTVVAIANRVAHLSERVEPAPPGSKERTFVVRAFLNAADTRVRLELRSGRTGSVPQQRYRQSELAVECRKPLGAVQQRLHVLIIAPEVPRRERAALARRVIEAVNGTVPADGFDRGEFKHPLFARAELYRPLVQDVEFANIVGLRGDVERAMRQATARKGEEWQNDVVLVYYQGRDEVVKDGLWLHTSMSYRAATISVNEMIRVADLAPAPGVALAVLNVIDPGRPPEPETPFIVLPLLRYPWKDSTGLVRLPELFKDAMAQERTLGRVAERVGGEVRKSPANSGTPVDLLPPEIRARAFSQGSP